MVEVATPSKFCFPLIYIFFEVMLMSRIDGIRSCLEDYILLFVSDVCMYMYVYMYVLCMHYVCIMCVCMYELPDDNKQEILQLKLFNIFC